MTTQLQPVLKPDKVPPANDGHVRDNLTADERLLRKAVDRCLKAQVAEVLERLEGGAVNKGGPGSGNFGHEGRPGEVGGSGPGGGGENDPIVSSELSQESKDKILAEASAKIDDSDFFEYGFRMLPPDLSDVSVGEKLKPSFEWVDGENTEQELGGVSTIGIKDSDHAGSALDNMVKNNYFGRKIALVRGIGVGSGEDIGERILKDAEVVAVWDVSKKKEKSLKSRSPASAIPSNLTKWDQAVMREVRPIWFGLFKKGGDKALKEIRRFPRYARKMAVLSKGMVEASERVEVKGGPGSGNFGHEGRPGEVGGSGPGDGGASNIEKESVVLYHGTKLEVRDAILKEGIKARVRLPDGRGSGVWMSDDPSNCTLYARENGIIFEVRVPSSDVEEVAGNYYSSKDSNTIPPERITAYYLYVGTGHIQKMSNWERHEVTTQKKSAEVVFYIPIQIRDKKETKSLKSTPSIVIPEWIEDPDVLDALEREMFKFAHGINQTTADALRDELMAGMEDGETISQLANRISGISDEWVEGWRSEMIARTETARAFTTGHIEAWRSTGVVSRKIWVSAGDCCPFCREMDGTVVDLDENFLEKGDEQDVPWRGQEIVMRQDYSDVNGPPLHPNCRCVLVAELDEEKMFVQKGGPGSGNFGHAGRPGEVGGSGPGSGGPLTSPEKVTSISDLERIANSGKLPSDTASYQYFYHAFRSRSTPDAVAKEGLKAGTTGGSVFLSKDEIRDLGAGYAVVRVPVGQAKESVDVVEQGLKYRQWTVPDVPVSDIVSIVREVPYGSGGHGTRENDLARWAIDHQGEDASDLPKQYRGWFNVQNAKSLKSTPPSSSPNLKEQTQEETDNE